MQFYSEGPAYLRISEKDWARYAAIAKAAAERDDEPEDDTH